MSVNLTGEFHAFSQAIAKAVVPGCAVSQKSKKPFSTLTSAMRLTEVPTKLTGLEQRLNFPPGGVCSRAVLVRGGEPSGFARVDADAGDMVDSLREPELDGRRAGSRDIVDERDRAHEVFCGDTAD